MAHEVPRRCEFIDEEQEFVVIVHYAIHQFANVAYSLDNGYALLPGSAL